MADLFLGIFAWAVALIWYAVSQTWLIPIVVLVLFVYRVARELDERRQKRW
jgi:hypothetical protein